MATYYAGKGKTGKYKKYGSNKQSTKGTPSAARMGQIGKAAKNLKKGSARAKKY